MPPTRDFRETVQARAKIDPVFREGLLTEGVDCLLAGEVEVGKILLRDYIDAAIGFDELGALTNKTPQSLMDMFGPRRQPARTQPIRYHRPHPKARRNPTKSEYAPICRGCR